MTVGRFLFLLPWVAFPAVLTSQPPQLLQITGRVYAMGVNFGIVSYFASALSCCKAMHSVSAVDAASPPVVDIGSRERAFCQLLFRITSIQTQDLLWR